MNLRFTDHNKWFQIGAQVANLASAAQDSLASRPGGYWLSNHDLILLNSALAEPPYDICAQTDCFFLFDAIFQRRSSVQEVQNPAFLRQASGVGPTPDYDLGVLGSWRSRAVCQPANSIYFTVLNTWDGSFSTAIGGFQANVAALLGRLQTSALLAPNDLTDLVAWVLINALVNPPGGSLTINGVTMAAQGGSEVRGCTEYHRSPIGIGALRFTAMQAARATIAGLGFTLP